MQGGDARRVRALVMGIKDNRVARVFPADQARRIEQISRGVFKVNPGSLLVALNRLERSGWLDAEWRETANSRRARYYTLTRAGRKQLERETSDWARRASAIARILKTEG